METLQVNATDFKRNTGALLNQVKYRGKRVIVKKHGQVFAVLSGVMDTHLPEPEVLELEQAAAARRTTSFWVQSLMRLAKSAGASGPSDLSQHHDAYLYH